MVKKLESNIIKKLEKSLMIEKEMALDTFWGDVIKAGAPLIEDIADDEENMLATVVYKHEEGINCISVNGEFFGFCVKDNQLCRIPTTDVWYRTYVVPKNVRSLYFFTINGDDEKDWCQMDLRVDPFNEKKYICPRDEEKPDNLALLNEVSSVLQMPNAANKKLIETRLDEKCGKLELSRFKSQILDNERRIWFYTPYEYKSEGEKRKLAIFLDGWEYINIVKAVNILDNLIADNIIPAICAVFVDSSKDRDGELTCYKPFVDFLAEEILPWIQNIYNVTRESNETIIVGYSYGALEACYAGLLYPNKFGKILGQSGGFSWSPDGEEYGWIVREFEKSQAVPLDLYLNIGSFELKWPFVVNSMNDFVKLLELKGYNIKNSVFTGGHVYTDWQDTLGEGLHWLLNI